MEQTSLGSSRAIMKLAFTVKWFSVLMFSWKISISGPILPSPSLTKHTNIRTYSTHWTSLRALLWMADVFSQNMQRVHESVFLWQRRHALTLKTMHAQCGGAKQESRFLHQSDYKADYILYINFVSSLHSNTHCTPTHAGTQYKPFSWFSHQSWVTLALRNSSVFSGTDVETKQKVMQQLCLIPISHKAQQIPLLLPPALSLSHGPVATNTSCSPSLT